MVTGTMMLELEGAHRTFIWKIGGKRSCINRMTGERVYPLTD